VQSIERGARERGYNLALVVVKPGSDPKRFVEDHFHNNFAGVVVLGGGDIGQAVIDSLFEEELPVILVDVSMRDTPTHSILADNFQGAYKATEYLIGRGYQRIACIQGPSKYPTLVERFRGYCCALITADLPFNPALAQEGLSQGVPEKGYREMKALIERQEPLDAVFCVSDRTAFGALRALHEAGIRVPEDIAVMGFDDVAQSAHTTPPLTTVHVPREAMGSLAIHRLHQLIKGESFPAPYKSVLDTSLVIRGSTL
jgi:DNA-binding LacI/PurR family transcriptional regulator